jgi:hypothetical protein
MAAQFKSVTALLAALLVVTTAGCTSEPTPDIEATVEARVKWELAAQKSKDVKLDPDSRPEADVRIGWYIESIKNSPTNEDKHRLAISLIIDEARIDPELFYFPNWPSLDEPSQSFDPAKAGRLFTELGDFRPWGKREFGRLCVVSYSKSDLQDRLRAIGDDIAAWLEAEAALDAVPNGSSCTAGRIIIIALRGRYSSPQE